MTMQHGEDRLSSAHEEPSTLNEETLEAVTGRAGPGWSNLGRSMSGHNLYSNAYDANDVIKAKLDPHNWEIGIGHAPVRDDGLRQSGYTIRPKNQATSSAKS